MESFEIGDENPVLARHKNKRNKRAYLIFSFFLIICFVIVFLLVKILLNIKIIRSKKEQNLKDQIELDKLLIEFEQMNNQTKTLDQELLNLQTEFKAINDKINSIQKNINELIIQNKELIASD